VSCSARGSAALTQFTRFSRPLSPPSSLSTSNPLHSQQNGPATTLRKWSLSGQGASPSVGDFSISVHCRVDATASFSSFHGPFLRIFGALRKSCKHGSTVGRTLSLQTAGTPFVARRKWQPLPAAPLFASHDDIASPLPTLSCVQQLNCSHCCPGAPHRCFLGGLLKPGRKFIMDAKYVQPC
jgi:hypothetical protein